MRSNTLGELGQERRRLDHGAARDRVQAEPRRRAAASPTAHRPRRRFARRRRCRQSRSGAARRSATIVMIDRHLAALPAGARRAEDRKAQHREGDRIDRRREPVMQLGAEMRRHLLVGRIVRIGERDVPQIALAHAECAELRPAGEARQVEGVALELDDGRVGASGSPGAGRCR